MAGSRFLCAVLFLLLDVAGSSASDDHLSLDQILERHAEALGGRGKLDAVQSVVLRFEYREGDFVIPHAYMAKMRPYYKTICEVQSALHLDGKVVPNDCTLPDPIEKGAVEINPEIVLSAHRCNGAPLREEIVDENL